MTTDDIAIAVEIPEVYDGVSAYLLKDGTWRNRWHNTDFDRRYGLTQDWIDQNGDTFRETNRDLLDGGEHG